MNILLSNDDGILAPGLAALYAAVADMGEVSVVAPDSPQSAAGHAITLTHPLVVQPVKVGGPGGFTGTSVDGRPADCVRLAIRNLLPAKPDLVLAGINAGNNVGINVFYSGTVAAATEAAMFDIPAVSFSASHKGEVDFARSARICRQVLDGLLKAGIAPGELVNVNIPTLSEGNPRGVRVVRQSTAGIEDVYIRQVGADGKENYRIADEYDFAVREQDTDVIRLAEGYVTVTPLHIDRTDHPRLKTLLAREWSVDFG